MRRAQTSRCCSECGVPYELLDRASSPSVEPAWGRAKARRRLAPAQRRDRRLPDVHPRLARMAGEAGVRVPLRRRVDGLDAGGRDRPACDDEGQGRQADRYVVALGSYSPAAPGRSAQPAGLPAQGVLADAADRRRRRARRKSTILDETYKIAITRFDDRIRVGGMAEMAGYDLAQPEAARDAGDGGQRSVPGRRRPARANSGPACARSRRTAPRWSAPPRTRTCSSIPGTARLAGPWRAAPGRYLADLMSGRAPEIGREGLDIFPTARPPRRVPPEPPRAPSPRSDRPRRVAPQLSPGPSHWRRQGPGRGQGRCLRPRRGALRAGAGRRSRWLCRGLHEEALELRQAGIRAPILLLEGFFDSEELALIAEHDLWTVIATPAQVHALAAFNSPRPLRVWFEAGQRHASARFVAGRLPRCLAALAWVAAGRLHRADDPPGARRRTGQQPHRRAGGGFRPGQPRHAGRNQPVQLARAARMAGTA